MLNRPRTLILLLFISVSVGGQNPTWFFASQNALPYKSDLTLHLTTRNGFYLHAEIGDSVNILTPTFLSSNGEVSYIAGLASRAEERLFDGNSYTIYFKFRLVNDVPGSGFPTLGYYTLLAGGAGTNRGMAWYIYNGNMILNISDGTTRYTPLQLTTLNNLNKNKTYEMFCEVDFELKRVRSKIYDGDVVISTSVNQDISTFVFNTNNNFDSFTFNSHYTTVWDFKKFNTLTTLANCRNRDYSTNLQIYLPDLLSGTDVSGNGIHFGAYSITEADKHYASLQTYLLDRGYYIYQKGYTTIQLPVTLTGNDPVNTKFTNYLSVNNIPGNSIYHNLADSKLAFTTDIFDRSNATIYTDEARLNYYDASNSKRWHISELDRLIMNDYFNSNYKGLIFPKITNNSTTDRQYLKEIIVYNTNKTGNTFNRVLTYTRDIDINNMIYLKTPYTQVIKVLANQNSEFTIKINKGLQYKNSDFVNEVANVPLLNPDEDFITKFFRYFTSNYYGGANLASTNNIDYLTIPMNMMNSYARPECSGLTIWGMNMLDSWIPRADLRAYYRVGDINGGTKDAMLWWVSRMLLYKGYYIPASMEEVQADVHLYNEPLKKTNSLLPYSGGESDLLLYARSAGYEQYSDVDYLTMRLPANCYFTFPVKSTNVPHARGAEQYTILDYANLIATIPAGATGVVDAPMMIVRITGSGTINLDGTIYTLPADEATILTRLETYDKWLHSVNIVESTDTGITVEYLLNSKRCLLFKHNTIDLTVLSGNVSAIPITTALVIPTFTLNVVTTNKFSFNNYLYYENNHSFILPTNTGSTNGVITFYKKTGQTKRSPLQINCFSPTANALVTITAGTQVIDECFAPFISPRDDTFSGTLEITLFSPTPGASIYYTTDGSTPDRTKILYATPFTISATTTIKAIAINADYGDSNIISRTITKQ